MLFNQVLSFLGFILLARTIDNDAMALWGVVTGVIGITAAFADLGLIIPMQRLLRTDAGAGRRLARRLFIIGPSVAFVASSLALFGMQSALPEVQPVQVVVLIGGIWSMAIVASRVAEAMLIAAERPFIAMIIGDGARLFITSVVLMSAGNGPLVAIAVGALMNIILAGTRGIIAGIRCQLRNFSGTTRLNVRNLLHQSTGIMAVTGAFAIRNRGDVILISFLFPIEQVAWFFVGTRLASFGVAPFIGIVNPLVPRAGQALLERSDALQNARTDLRQGVRYALVCSSITFVAVLLVGKPVFAWLGPNFANAWGVTTILLGGWVVNTAMGPANMLLRFANRSWTAVLVDYTTLVIGFLLLLLGAIIGGLEWAAAGTAIGMAIRSIVSTVVLQRIFGFNSRAI